MNDTASQSTLREWRRHMTAPTAMAIMLGTAVILAMTGPFDTDRMLRWVPRLGYWLAMVVCCYSAGYLVNALIDRFWRRPADKVFLLLMSCSATGAVVSGVVLVLNGLTLGYWPDLAALPFFVLNVFVIAFVVSGIFFVIEHEQKQAPDAPPRVAILDRLPLEKRGILYDLSVEDHYVQVRTSKGIEMVLMRLSDAMKEVGDVAGLQVHRSHWVALAAIRDVARKGDGAVVHLLDGSQIPVSRSNLAKVRDAGLLPGRANG